MMPTDWYNWQFRGPMKKRDQAKHTLLSSTSPSQHCLNFICHFLIHWEKTKDLPIDIATSNPWKAKHSHQVTGTKTYTENSIVYKVWSRLSLSSLLQTLLVKMSTLSKIPNYYNVLLDPCIIRIQDNYISNNAQSNSWNCSAQQKPQLKRVLKRFPRQIVSVQAHDTEACTEKSTIENISDHLLQHKWYFIKAFFKFTGYRCNTDRDSLVPATSIWRQIIIWYWRYGSRYYQWRTRNTSTMSSNEAVTT